MSSLASLKEKLQKLEVNTKVPEPVSNTVELTDHQTWMNKIATHGHRPEDWVDYVEFVINDVTLKFSDPLVRHNLLCDIYTKAFKSINPDVNKRNVLYAKLFIDYAELKSQYLPDDAQELLSHARNLLPRFTIVHVAAAEFELMQGNTGKAKKILEKALLFEAKPAHLLTTALQNLKEGHTKLLSEEDKENLTNISGSSSRGSTSSQDSSGELQVGKPLKMMKRNFEDVHSGARTKNFPSEEQTTHVDTTVSFKPPRQPHQACPDRMRSHSGGSIQSDDTETEPFDSVKMPHATGSLQATCGHPPIRSYHSTPEIRSVQNMVSSASRSRWKRPSGVELGMPMRVKKLSLPFKNFCEEEEEDEEESADRDIVDGFKLLEPMEYGSATFGSTSQAHTSGYLSMSHTDMTIPMEQPKLAQVAKMPKVDESVPGTSEEKMPPRSRNIPASLESQKEHSTQEHEEGPSMPTPDHQSETTNQNPLAMSDDKNGHMQSSVKPTNHHSSQSQQLQEHPQHNLKQPPVPDPAYMRTPSHHGTQVTAQATSHENNHKQRIVSSQAQQNHHQTPSHHGTSIPPPVASTPSMKNQGQGMPPVPYTPSMVAREILTVNGQQYSVLGVIGRGGSSKVYQVLDCQNKLKAVKEVSLEEANESIVEGYKNEIRLLDRLQNCDKIIKMFDFEYNQEKNCLFVVMECGNEDLANFFKQQTRKGGKLSDNLIKFYWEVMLIAVQALHREGIIHSDLKPANFLFVGGNLKLIDFGIAKAIQQDKTSVLLETQVGTLNYMSPEAIVAASGEGMVDGSGNQRPVYKIGVKSDVWSLGCIMYNMVYGRTPFQHITHQFAKLQAITNPRYPIEFQDIPDKHLLDVMKRCLTRDTKQRPTIDELLQHPYLAADRTEERGEDKEKAVNKHRDQILKQGNFEDIVNAMSPGSLQQLESLVMKRRGTRQENGASSCSGQHSKDPVKQIGAVRHPVATTTVKQVRAPLQSLNLAELQKPSIPYTSKKS